MLWPPVRCAGIAALLCVPAFASAQVLVKCEKPEGKQKIQSFTVAYPGSIDDAYNATLEAFITTGFVPNAATQIANQVQWSSGADYNALDEATRTRYIRGVVFAKGSGSIVNVSAFEEVSGSSMGSGDPLSNRNSGYGFKVWCAARRIADTLTATAARVQQDEVVVASPPSASHLTSSAQPIGLPTEPTAGSYTVAFLELSDGGSSQRVAGSIVTPSFLPAGLTPEIGHLFQPSDFEATSVKAVLLSDRLWRERYKGLPAVVGMAVELGGKQAVVVGVLPADFDFPSGVELWVTKR